MKKILIALVLLVMVGGTAYAQDDAPLVFFGRGLMTFNEATGRVTPWERCGDGYIPRLSPTGEWLAKLDNDLGLRLCNLYTREVRMVYAPDEVVRGALSSYPAWSPDGQSVAWSASIVDENHWLMVYSLETDETRVLLDGLPTGGVRPQVLWGESGLLVVVDDRDPERIVAPLYSPEGELLAEDLSNDTFFTMYFWVTDDDGKEYLGRYVNYIYGDIIDPQTGDVFLPENVELYSLLAPDGVGVVMQKNARDVLITLPDGDDVSINDLSPSLSDFIPYFQFDPHNIAISPQGDAIAIFDLDQLIWRDGEVTMLPNSIPSADGTGVLWGPMAYRIRGELFSARG